MISHILKKKIFFYSRNVNFDKKQYCFGKRSDVNNNQEERRWKKNED